MFKEEVTQYCPMCEEWAEKYDQLKKENEELKKSVISNKDRRKKAIEKYLKLKEFTNKEFKKLEEEIKKEKALKQTYLSCYKTKHVDVKCKLFKYEIYKQALQDIKDYYNKYPQNSIGFKEQILQKCEVIDE